MKEQLFSQLDVNLNSFYSKRMFCSIITVVYNNLEGLKKTYESIAQQTSQDFEWLVIDGASSDGTLEWLKEISALYAPLIYYSEKDKGLYDAMNKGLKKAKGDFVWFMNSSDLIYHSEVVAQLLSYSASDVIYGETMFVDANGEEIGLRSKVSTRRLPQQMSRIDMLFGMVVSHQSILVRRSLAIDYDLQYRCSADIDWVISALTQSKQTSNSHIILSKYLVGGYSAQHMKMSWKERFFIYKKHYGLLATLFAHVWIVAKYMYLRYLKGVKY
jgi:glycosyltransferase involved in cell wall biosynthesis